MKALLTAGIIIIFGAGLALAVELPQSVLEREIQTIKTTSLSQGGPAVQGGDFDEFATEADDDLYKYEFKSPKKAFLMSLAVPGWGQYYARSNFIKPVLMVAVEIGSWVGYFKYHNDGNKLTDEFQAFADEHWIEGDRNAEGSFDGHNYWDWYRYFENKEPADPIPGNEHLPETRTQQYYEMIGKYDQFAGGWEDYWDPAINPKPDDLYENLTLMTPMRLQYESMRDKANDKLDQANKFIIVAMANHLLSAFDAALAANRFNKNKTGDNWLSVQAEMKKFSEIEEVPIVRFTYHF